MLDRSDQAMLLATQCRDLYEHCSTRMKCPWCSPNRRRAHRGEKDLAVRRKDDLLLYCCHHCGEEGAVPVNGQEFRDSLDIDRGFENKTRARTYMTETRRIPIEVCRQEGVTFEDCYGEAVVHFPVCLPNGSPVGIKKRYVSPPPGRDRYFYQKGTPQIISDLHRIDPLIRNVIIAEGEIDRLTFIAAGYKNVLALPGGVKDRKDGVQHYFEDDAFVNALRGRTIICATDADESGQRYASDLAQVAGVVSRLEFPEGIKDANEYLQKYGMLEFQKFVGEFVKVRPAGAFTMFKEGIDEALQRYEAGIGPELTVGFQALDEMWTWHRGMLAVMTGYAGSGKSAFVAWLVSEIYRHHRMPAVFCSFEHPTWQLRLRLAAACCDLPVFAKEHKPTSERVARALNQLDRHFAFVDYTDTPQQPTLSNILGSIELAVRDISAGVVVIDPWNGIAPDPKQSERQWITSSLTILRQLAMRLDVVMIVVAHPTKPLKGIKLTAPSDHDVAGSNAWSTKSDLILSCHRAEPRTPFTDLHCWKLRNEFLAAISPRRVDLRLEYDPACCQYSIPAKQGPKLVDLDDFDTLEDEEELDEL